MAALALAAASCSLLVNPNEARLRPADGSALDVPTGPFDPSHVARCVGWFRADRGVTRRGDRVALWADQCAAGHDLAQTTAARQPGLITDGPNGQPALHFDGTDDYLRVGATFALEQPVHVFLVYRLVTVSQPLMHDVVFDGFYAGSATLAVDGTPRTVLFAGGVVSTARAVGGEGFVLVTAAFRGAQSELRVGGTQVATGDGGSTAPGGFTLGALGDGTRNSSLEVAELAVYAGGVSDADRATLEAYLTARYGL